jgi:hypothetical protein
MPEERDLSRSDLDGIIRKQTFVFTDPAKRCRDCGGDQFRVLGVGKKELFRHGKHYVQCTVRCLRCNLKIGAMRDLALFPPDQRPKIIVSMLSQQELANILPGSAPIAALLLLIYLSVEAVGTYGVGGIVFMLPVAIALATLVWFLLRPMLIREAAHQRWTSGQCPQCAYDVRAMQRRCPECGLELPRRR